MSSPGLWDLPLNFDRGDLVLLGIKDQDVVEVITEAASEHVDFILQNCRTVSPSRQESIVLHLPLPPFQLSALSRLQQILKINRIDIAQATVFGMASCDNKELCAYFG